MPVCEKCGRRLPVSAMTSHMKVHKSFETLRCQICNCLCLRQPDLQLHMKLFHSDNQTQIDEDKVECKDCGEFIPKGAPLRMHMNLHKYMECNICTAKFKEKIDFNKHMRNVHQLEKCSFCKEYVENIEKHLYSCPLAKQFQCFKCKTSFKNFQNLQAHLKKEECSKEAMRPRPYKSNKPKFSTYFDGKEKVYFSVINTLSSCVGTRYLSDVMDSPQQNGNCSAKIKISKASPGHSENQNLEDKSECTSTQISQDSRELSNTSKKTTLSPLNLQNTSNQSKLCQSSTISSQCSTDSEELWNRGQRSYVVLQNDGNSKNPSNMCNVSPTSSQNGKGLENLFSTDSSFPDIERSRHPSNLDIHFNISSFDRESDASDSDALTTTQESKCCFNKSFDRFGNEIILGSSQSDHMENDLLTEANARLAASALPSVENVEQPTLDKVSRALCFDDRTSSNISPEVQCSEVSASDNIEAASVMKDNTYLSSTRSIIPDEKDALKIIPVRCDICHKEFSSSDFLKDHQCKEHPICDICGKTIFNQPQQNSRNIDLGQQPRCNVCNELYRLSLSVQNQIVVPEKMDTFKCQLCGKGFEKLKNVKLHSRIHTKLKPHVCKICGKSFMWLKSLKNHENLHSGLKPYRCSICKKQFCGSVVLKLHISNIHKHLTASYQCSTCLETFPQVSTLEKHLYKHKKGLKYSCEKCGRKFANKFGLKSHYVNTHKDITYVLHSVNRHSNDKDVNFPTIGVLGQNLGQGQNCQDQDIEFDDSMKVSGQTNFTGIRMKLETNQQEDLLDQAMGIKNESLVNVYDDVSEMEMSDSDVEADSSEKQLKENIVKVPNSMEVDPDLDQPQDASVRHDPNEGQSKRQLILNYSIKNEMIDDCIDYSENQKEEYPIQEMVYKMPDSTELDRTMSTSLSGQGLSVKNQVEGHLEDCANTMEAVNGLTDGSKNPPLQSQVAEIDSNVPVLTELNQAISQDHNLSGQDFSVEGQGHQEVINLSAKDCVLNQNVEEKTCELSDDQIRSVGGVFQSEEISNNNSTELTCEMTQSENMLDQVNMTKLNNGGHLNGDQDKKEGLGEDIQRQGQQKRYTVLGDRESTNSHVLKEKKLDNIFSEHLRHCYKPCGESCLQSDLDKTLNNYSRKLVLYKQMMQLKGLLGSNRQEELMKESFLFREKYIKMTEMFNQWQKRMEIRNTIDDMIEPADAVWENKLSRKRKNMPFQVKHLKGQPQGQRVRRGSKNVSGQVKNLPAGKKYRKTDTLLHGMNREYVILPATSQDNNIPLIRALSGFNMGNAGGSTQKPQQSEKRNTLEQECIMRIGTLSIHSLGRIQYSQSATTFHTKEYIYPVGYKSSRMYHSMRQKYGQCRYMCSIAEKDGRPLFSIEGYDPGYSNVVFRGSSIKNVFGHVIEMLEKNRSKGMFSNAFLLFRTGEDFFGLSDPKVKDAIEKLPGASQLEDYFLHKEGLNPELYPFGSARTKAVRVVSHTKRHCKLKSRCLGIDFILSRPKPNFFLSPFKAKKQQSAEPGLTDGSYRYLYNIFKQQYQELKHGWKNRIYVGRSNIQGLGVFASTDMKKNTLVIEYIGELIRNTVADSREKKYKEQNRGVYMFRLNDDKVVDATCKGGPGRYINHSCNPNCLAEVFKLDDKDKIIIITNSNVKQGQELTYDYRFDIEDEEQKIPCLCGSSHCRMWMN